MKSTSATRLILFALGMLLVGVAPVRTFAWSLDVEPVEGVVVLKNGNTLHGKIQKLSGDYHVHLTNGKLQIRGEQVDFVAENLEQAYQRRRESRSGSTADSHLELASWCLRHDLYEQAEAELDAAGTIDADHRRLPLLRRQLVQSRLMAQRRAQQIQQAEATPPELPPLDPQSLDKAPPWARALFVRQIQPLIVQSCATTGCHQVGGERSLQLNRLAIEGAGHPETTGRNLAAVLEQIDWNTTDASQLVQFARRGHATSEPLPQHKQQVLENWVAQLIEAEQKANQIQLLPPVVEIAQLPKAPSLKLISPQMPSASQAPAVKPASYQPKDAFDPQSFNQRYAPVEQQPTPATTVPPVSAPGEEPLILLPAAE